MTREEFFEIYHNYNLRLTGHQVWIGYLYHIANLEANTRYDYKILPIGHGKIETKEAYEKYVQKYVLITKENAISKKINKMKGDF